LRCNSFQQFNIPFNTRNQLGFTWMGQTKLLKRTYTIRITIKDINLLQKIPLIIG